MTTIKFCECGLVFPCKHKNHKEFDAVTYRKEHLKQPKKHHGGYSKQREEDGEFQPGVDKDNFK